MSNKPREIIDSFSIGREYGSSVKIAGRTIIQRPVSGLVIKLGNEGVNLELKGGELSPDSPEDVSYELIGEGMRVVIKEQKVMERYKTFEGIRCEITASGDDWCGEVSENVKIVEGVVRKYYGKGGR